MHDRKALFAGYRRAARFLIPYRWRLVLILLTGVAATSFGLIQPYTSKLLIDEALAPRDFQKLLLVSLLMVTATVVSFALNILSSYQYVRMSAVVLFDMRVALYRHLQLLSPRFWVRSKLGDVVSRINGDISEVQRISADSLLSVLSNVVFLIGSAVIMASLNMTLFMLSLIVLPFSLWTLRHYQNRLVGRVKAVRERGADIGSFLIETLLGIRVVVTAGAEVREVERFRYRNQSFLDALLSMQMTSFLSGAVPGTLITLSTAAIFLYGGKLVIDRELSIGSLVAVMAYHGRLLTPIQNLMSLYSNLVSGGVSLSRVFELFDTTPEVADRALTRASVAGRGDVDCRDVSFSYDGESVLNKLSFHVPAGTICAIVGPSGVGKSTLADLLVRFYDPQTGEIHLDGQDLRELRLQDLRRQVMLLDQAPFLFQSSIRDNIAYARPDATDEEIIEAARAAAIHQRILAFPDGYSTTLAERGQGLSAGERQRLALARALLANPKVLVLDEPTSALDEDNERLITETLGIALAGRTAIIITHRPAVAAIAHQVITLQK
ncbi:MAG: ABC transporter ATP-binding protein [Acidobacteriota bacterium]